MQIWVWAVVQLWATSLAVMLVVSTAALADNPDKGRDLDVDINSLAHFVKRRHH